tara:strand:+ start:200 stop:589 length:390 start_codon:yes stop_codon:yes gene_type:complete
MSIHVRVIWEWLKKNWKLSLLVVWSILVWFFSRRSSQAAIEAMNANKESYEARIRALKEQRKIEIQKREELTLKYEETLAKIEKKYEKKLRDLSKEEKSRIKEIIEKAKGNPAEIDEKIENLFGFVSSD